VKRSSKIAFGIAASLSLSLVVGTALAQPAGMDGHMMHGMGPHMMHGMGHGAAAGNHRPMVGAVAMLTQQDVGSSADMDLVHELLANHEKIRRTVTNLPDGIRTATESDDPKVAQAIKAHVASMSQRLKDGREFNIFSSTLPILFENRDKIRSILEVTEKGYIVTRTSADPKVVAALQGHAGEVTELVQEGMVAMRRGMMARMAMGPRGPRAGGRPGSAPGASTEHAP
jgi:hypothetical protein